LIACGNPETMNNAPGKYETIIQNYADFIQNYAELLKTIQKANQSTQKYINLHNFFVWLQNRNN
jgi:hypothetical protein